MRWTAFIAGSIAGATAAAMVAKRRPEVIRWAADAVEEAWSSMINRGIERVVRANFFQMNKTDGISPKTACVSAEESEASWKRIEQFVETDPALKQEVQKVLLDNQAGQTH